MARRRIILALMTCGVVLLVVAVWPHNQPFSKLVLSPVPASVRVNFYQSGDWLGLNPEPVYYLAFTASTDDMAQVIAEGNFNEVATNAYVPTAGPLGWRAFEDCGMGRRLFTRNHPGQGLPIGRRRSWSEYLWVDATGTNAYFLIWGI
jgi:hypothetical protein